MDSPLLFLYDTKKTRKKQWLIFFRCERNLFHLVAVLIVT